MVNGILQPLQNSLALLSGSAILFPLKYSKSLFLLISLFFISKLYAASYYFSDSQGDDARTNTQAQNPATPWKTLYKLNSIFDSLQPGDSLLLKRGDVFYGSITISKSGTATLPIVISAYGTGALPLISGLTTLTTWSSLGNGIYQSPCPSCKPTDNLLIVNGQPQMLGRYPNTGYLTLESHSSTTSITDDQLSGSPNWTGAEIVIRKNRWIIDRNKIIAHSGHTISYTSASTYPAIDSYGYFIQNDPKTLDTLGEWYFEPVGKNMQVYFGSNNPSSYTVQTSSIDTLVYMRYINYVTFDNLSFEGANLTAFEITASGHVTIQNCNIDFSGGNAITGPGSIGSPYLTIERTSINNTYNNAIDLRGNFPFTSIQNNSIKNTGMIPGMGRSGNLTYQGITTFGRKGIIEYNEVINTGYTPIWFAGDSLIVKNNFLNNFTSVKDDGGGIYTWNGAAGAVSFHGMEIVGNIILNGLGAPKGTNSPDYLAARGIYADDNSSNIKIFGNTVSNCAHSGIYLHNTHDIQVLNNTCFNNNTQINIVHDSILAGSPTRNLTIQKNTFFSTETNQAVLNFSTIGNDISLFGNADSNYYARPLDDDYFLITKTSTEVNPGISLSLKAWQTFYNKDLHSKKSPRAIDEYTLHSLTGTNKLINGDFDANVKGSYCWSLTGSCVASWDGSGKIDGGTLKISYNEKTNKNAIVVLNVGNIHSGKNYILKFSVAGSKQSRSIGAYLRQSYSPYKNLSFTRYAGLSTSRSDHTILFSPVTGENKACIVFQVNEADSSLWLDNIEFYEADVTITKPGDYIRFEYNPANKNKIVPIDGTYVGIDSSVYSNTVTIAPYSSVVLIKDSQSIALPLQFLGLDGKKIENRIDLRWETMNELNTDSFEVIKSRNGIQFEAIGRLAANNIPIKSTYTFSDNNPYPGKNYYQVKQVDKDGKYSFSEVIVISYVEAVNMQIIPNPAIDKITVTVNSGRLPPNATLLIRNISGNILKGIPVNFSSAGIQIDISTLTSGVYFVSLLYGGSVFNQKFIKQ